MKLMKPWILVGALSLGVAPLMALNLDDPSPLAPTSLSAVNEVRGVGLTWELSPDDGEGANDVTGYKIYRRPVGGVFAERGTVVAGTTGYFDRGELVDGADYEYMVRTWK